MSGFFKPNVEKMYIKGDIEGLVKALKHRDENVRYMAAWALGEIGDARAVEPLSNALKDEKSDVRRQAAWSLKKIEAKVEAKGKGYRIIPL